MTIKVGKTIKLAAGPEVKRPEDIHLLPHRARLHYDPDEDTIYLDLGAPNIMTSSGSTGMKGTITTDCAAYLLDLLNLWNEGEHE